MLEQKKALVGGGVGMLAPPLMEIITWVSSEYLHMPDNIALATGTLLVGILGWALVYIIPNNPPTSGG